VAQRVGNETAAARDTIRYTRSEARFGETVIDFVEPEPERLRAGHRR
jgi:hypothetical protein